MPSHLLSDNDLYLTLSTKNVRLLEVHRTIENITSTTDFDRTQLQINEGKLCRRIKQINKRAILLEFKSNHLENAMSAYNLAKFSRVFIEKAILQSSSRGLEQDINLKNAEVWFNAIIHYPPDLHP